MPNIIQQYADSMISFGVFLLIFFACILASVDQDKSCPTSNRELNTTAIVFGVIGIFVSLVMIFFSSHVKILLAYLTENFAK